MTVFSLNPVRIPNCIDGGIVIFKEKEIFEKAILIRDCGIDRTKFRDELGEINPDCDINLSGYSATMSDVNGYIGSQQMEHVNTLFERQRNNAERWEKMLDEEKGVFSITRKETIPNYWVYGVLSNNKREDILRFRDKGYYASGVHFPNNRYSAFGVREMDLLGTMDFYDRFLALPCGWWMRHEVEERP